MSESLSDKKVVMTADVSRCENPLDMLDWEIKPVLLRFRLGEFVLGYFRATGIKNATHVSNIDPIAEPTAPRVALGKSEGATIISCPIANKLPKLSVQSGWIMYVTWQYHHQLVRISGSFLEYEERWRSKTRSTVRRKVRRFIETAGDCTYFRVFEKPEEMNQFFNDARRVSELTYQERLLGQGIPDSESYRDNLTERAKTGSFLGYVLYLDQQPVAYTAGDVLGPGVISYGQTGYDPSVSHLSPGTVLQYLLIQSLFQEQRFAVYDLCIGEAESKKLFSNYERECADIIFLRSSLKNWTVVLCHIVLEAVNDFAVYVLKRLRVHQVLKRAIRRMA